MTDQGDPNLHEEYNEDLPYIDGKVDFRQHHGCCRDFYCLILFFAAIGGAIALFVIGFSKDQAHYLYAPINSKSEFCGRKENTTRATYDNTNFPNLISGLAIRLNFNLSDPLNTTIEAEKCEICVKDCPAAETCVCSNGTITPDSNLVSCATLPNETACIYVPFKTISVLDRCIPSGEGVLPEIAGMENMFTSAMSDLRNGWWLILVAAGVCLVLSFLWVCCVSCCGKCIVWSTLVLGTLVLLAIGGFALYYGIKRNKEADAWTSTKNPDETSAIVFMVIGGILLLAALILLFIMCGLHRSINLAFALIKEGASVLKSQMCMVFVPIVYIVLFVVGAVLVVVALVYYVSSRTEIAKGSRYVQWDVVTVLCIVLLILLFFWNIYFFLGMKTATVAGSTASWYFAYDKKDDTPRFPIARSVMILVCHHLGSVAVGSFLIAFIQTLRTILLYLEKKMKESTHTAARYVLACLQCCLKCWKCILQYITERAYIWMGISGSGFFRSARDAIALLLRHPATTFILDGVTTFIVTFGSLVVTALSVFVMVLIMRPDFFSDSFEVKIPIYHWWLIAVISGIVSFVFSTIILGVYDTMIDTVFLCYLKDEEIADHKGALYTIYARPQLKKHMNRAARRGDKRRERIERIRKEKEEEDEEDRKWNKGGDDDGEEEME
ncbi:Choline-transporter-like protein [Blattamonas nauphoetae]|uniref:Choline transporter-like protein n=1 Tax=Blattamonas nauphoetae TaxID=2049346 RepID=A0ABQ9XQA3_9EUKA|nr:Choline-transporter-like protein [Blattamonas nauphoetae]